MTTVFARISDFYPISRFKPKSLKRFFTFYEIETRKDHPPRARGDVLTSWSCALCITSCSHSSVHIKVIWLVVISFWIKKESDTWRKMINICEIREKCEKKRRRNWKKLNSNENRKSETLSCILMPWPNALIFFKKITKLTRRRKTVDNLNSSVPFLNLGIGLISQRKATYLPLWTASVDLWSNLRSKSTYEDLYVPSISLFRLKQATRFQADQSASRGLSLFRSNEPKHLCETISLLYCFAGSGMCTFYFLFYFIFCYE